MDYLVEYDKSDPVSIEEYSQGMIGKTFRELCEEDACNSDSRADFYEAGVELKVTPYRINHNGTLSAKERLILTMIDYYQVVNMLMGQ